jgi:uncharacterized protein involved in exopolysaccharide biosynthesis
LDFSNKTAVEEQSGISRDVLEIPQPAKSILSALVRYRWYILARAAITAGIFTVLAFVIPANYESVAQLMPPDESASTSMAGAAEERAASMIGLPPELLGGQTNGALFSRILTSESAEDAVIARFDLRRIYGVRYLQDARRVLEKNTRISLDRKSGVLSIGVRDKDPGRAKAICQAYVDELNLLASQLSTSSARREREFLEGRLKVIKKELDDSAANLGQFSSKNKTLDLSQEGKAMVEAVAALEGQLVSAEAELDGLKKIYGEENVHVTAAEARVAELRRNLQMEAGRESSPSVDASLPYPSIRDLPLIGVTYSDLLQRTEINASVYETLTKEYEMARVQEAKDIPTVRLLDPPSYPEKPVPGRRLFVVFGIILGLAIPGIWVYFKEVHPETLRTGPAAESIRALRSDFRAVANVIHRRKTCP